MIRVVLLDIEGTITSVDFVYNTLFPYAAEHMPDFLRQHENDPEIKVAIQEIKATVLKNRREVLTRLDEVIERLRIWMANDRKDKPLKTIQGRIWEDGYRTEAFQGHIYDEVPQVLQKWYTQGKTLAIYSSGSVKAQKLLLRFSCHGNLTPLFSYYFDTAVGGKRDTESYRKIVKQLGVPSPNQVLFLSDVKEELDAAAQAGLCVIQVNREANPVETPYKVISSLDKLSWTDIKPEQPVA